MSNLFPSENVGLVNVCRTANYELKVIQNFPAKAYLAHILLLFAFNILLSLSTIFLNFVTIATFRSSNHLQKKVYYFLIYVQSWNDLFIGLVVSSLFLIYVGRYFVGDANCDVYFVFYITFFTTNGFSVIILSAMNVERYASIVHPISHRNKFKKKKLLMYILSSCLLCLCVSGASVKLSQEVLRQFVGCGFQLHFVSTVYFYARIFLVMRKARFKRSPDSVRPESNVERVYEENLLVIQSNNQVNQQGNQGNRPDNHDNRPDNQQHNQGNQQDNECNRPDNQDVRSDNQDNQSDNQDNRTHNRKEASDNQGNSSNYRRNLSDNHGKLLENGQLFNQRRESNSQCRSSDNQGQQSTTPERQFENLGGQSDHQSKRFDRQDNTSDSRHNRSDHQSDSREQNNYQQSSFNENSNLSNQSSMNRKSVKEFLMKFKLAKSCLVVVLCSFVTYFLPAILQRLPLGDFDKLVLNGWCVFLLLSNSTLNSLIFFWKNKILRKEGKKFWKRFGKNS